MDIDSELDKISASGTAQMRIVYLLNSALFFPAFHALIISFVGEDPGWSCPGPRAQGEAERCLMVSDGSCTPQYSKDFTSIVTEVEAPALIK